MTTTGAPPAATGAGPSMDLGEVAVFNGLISREQLDECLGIQAEVAAAGLSIPLWQILVEKFYLDRPSIRAIQKALRGGAAAGQEVERFEIVKFTPAEHDVVIERCRTSGLISPERVDECFDIQTALDRFGIDKQLCEIVLAKGYVGRELVQDILEKHEERRKDLIKEVVPEGPPAQEIGASPLLFGQIAIQKELISGELIDEILHCQAKLKEVGVAKRIGELLVERGWLRTPDVQRVLALQKQMYGQFRWEAMELAALDHPDDIEFRGLLLSNDILGEEEIKECQYVLSVMHGLGFAKKRLSDVVVDKAFLDREIAVGIVKTIADARKAQAEEKARLADGLSVEPSESRIHSVALAATYEKIIRSRQSDTQKVRPLTRASKAVAAEPLHARLMRPRLAPLAILGAIAVALAGVLAAVTARGPQTQGPAETPAPRAGSGTPRPPGSATDGTARSAPVPPDALETLARAVPIQSEGAAASQAIAIGIGVGSPQGRMDEAYLLVRGESVYPEGTRIGISVRTGEALVGEVEVCLGPRASGAKTAFFHVFGPFRTELGRALSAAGSPWLPPAAYVASAEFDPTLLDQEAAAATLRAGFPLAYQRASASLDYPDASHEERRKGDILSFHKYLANEYVVPLAVVETWAAEFRQALEGDGPAVLALADRLQAASEAAREKRAALERASENLRVLGRLPALESALALWQELSVLSERLESAKGLSDPDTATGEALARSLDSIASRRGALLEELAGE
ncbi:MAG: hypothetical protein HY720_08440 [Planctomycetes bacterium]|nr:hypothetical protein [Planctomycetota bacterium]